MSIEALEELHRRVDEEAVRCAETLATDWGHPSRCGLGCARCCQDELTVFEVEAELIQHHHAELLRRGHPHSPGACAFLDDEGGCRVYAQRPYVCRTQGLPLRWLEPDGEGGGFEYRDICARNESAEGVDLVELPPEVFWTIGSWESRLRMMQELRDGGEGRRVPLRSLFARS